MSWPPISKAPGLLLAELKRDHLCAIEVPRSELGNRRGVMMNYILNRANHELKRPGWRLRHD